MSTAANRIVIAVLVLLGAQRGAKGHSIGESNATFYVRSTGIDVDLYLAMASGARLLADEGQIIPMTPDNFADYAESLRAVGPDLLTVTGGDGTVLKPDALTVSMTETTDVLYNLHYPLPTPMPGVLKIHAGYLDKMVETHVGTFYVMNTVGDQFGWGTVSPDSEDLQVRLPAVADLIRTASPASVVAATSSAQSRHGARWLWWGLLGGSALIVAAAALRGMAGQREDAKLAFDVR